MLKMIAVAPSLIIPPIPREMLNATELPTTTPNIAAIMLG
jgi:hypothetical protein